MEHRWKKRFRTDFGAILYLKGCRPVICRARNMSGEGVFLSLLEPIPGLEPTSAVDLEIFYPTQGSPIRQKATGIVVHRDHGGIGVMLRGAQLQPLSTLSKIKVGRARAVQKGSGKGQKKTSCKSPTEARTPARTDTPPALRAAAIRVA